MGPLLIVLFTLYQLQTSTSSEVLDAPQLNFNALADERDDELNALIPPEVIDTGDLSDERNDIPYVRAGHDQTEVEFRHPIASVNIDYSKNVIVLKFRKQAPKRRTKLDPEEEQKRRALESNFMRFGRTPAADFMRFGRTPAADFMRFGKRQVEQLPSASSIDRGYYAKDADADGDGDGNRRFGRSEGMRDSRGDNFMRFGKSSKDFMRFGKSSKDFMRFGRSPADFMRLGRSPSDFMRLGRSPADFMRLGRSPSDFMRLGRSGPDDFMRFGRTPEDFMRFGRDSKTDFIRFGRTQQAPRMTTDHNFMRSGRPDNFMRFGRTTSTDTSESSNFMRFGKSSTEQQSKENQTEASTVKQETAQLLRQAVQDNAELDSNPMDKAIKALYRKHQHQQQHKQQPNNAATDEAELANNDELDTDMDYALNMAQ